MYLHFFINFLPVGMIGFKFASKYAEDNTFKFGHSCQMLLLAFFFVVILDLVMTAFGVFIAGNGTMNDYLFAVVAGFVPCYIPTLITGTDTFTTPLFASNFALRHSNSFFIPLTKK